MRKPNDSFGWAVSIERAPKAKRSVWDRIVGKDDDDDDLGGPNAGATLWPTVASRHGSVLSPS